MVFVYSVTIDDRYVFNNFEENKNLKLKSDYELMNQC